MRWLVGAIVLASVPCGAAVVIEERGFQIDGRQFDQWVFGRSQSDTDADSQIAVALEAVDRICHLTKPQRDKLRLAARGDFARFDQRVEELRAKFAEKVHDQNDLNQILQETQPLRTAYQAGLLGPSSLFAKSLPGILTPEQLEKYQAGQADRTRARHDAKVRLLVATLERRCPLKHQQRTALIELLLAETRPPKRSSQLDQYVILVQASRIPDEKFSTILDEKQLPILEKMLEQARSLEPHLKQQGVLP
jgi:hypothetical protein